MTATTFSPLSGTSTDPQTVRESFWQDGVVVIHDVLSDAQIDAADAALQALLPKLNDQPWGGGEVYCETMETWTKPFGGLTDPALVALFEAPVVKAYTKAVAGADDYRELGIGAWATSEGHGQAWHQDSEDNDPSTYCINRIVFTRDVLPGQGDLLIVPGSHRGRDLPAGDLYEPIEGQVAVTPKRNTLVLLHTRCFHCVTRNQTSEVRIQANRRVVPAGVDPSICGRARFRTGVWDFSKRTLN